jgi:adenylate cyclase
MLEIEKKFLLKALPAGIANGVKILQGYFSTGDPELRVRSKGSKRFVTRKSGSGLIRDEEEAEITEKAFKVLWPATAAARIEKTRYQIVGHDGLTWEIDEYHGALKGLYTAEVELPNGEITIDMPNAVCAVLVRDVTEDKAYKNKSLAVNGLPK